MENIQPTVLPLVVWPDERLHQKCEDVSTFDDWVKQFAANLLATMQVEDGVGLSAPQVGVNVNIIAVWIEENNPLVLINPTVIKQSKEMFKWDEGCLSVPGYFEVRQRPKSITVSYKDINGDPHTSDFSDLYAFTLQHEIDHLHGRLFIDGLSNLKKDRIRSKMKKYLKRRPL